MLTPLDFEFGEFFSKHFFYGEVPEDLFKKFSRRRIGWLNPSNNEYRVLFMIAAQKDGSVLISSTGNIPTEHWSGYIAKVYKFGFTNLSEKMEKSFDENVAPKINFHRSGNAGISRTESTQKSIYTRIFPLRRFWRSQIFSVSNYRADLIPPTIARNGDIYFTYASSGPTLIHTKIFLVDILRLIGNRTYLHENQTGGAFIHDGQKEILSFSLRMHKLRKIVAFKFISDTGVLHKDLDKPIIHLFAFHKGFSNASKVVGLRSDTSIPSIISTAKRQDIPFKKFYVKKSIPRDVTERLHRINQI